MHQKVHNQYISQTRFLFHCHIKIKIPIQSDVEIINKSFAIYEDFDKQYNSYQSGSYFDEINKNTGNWVKVDRKCIDILNTISHISNLTDGAYDITCMPLLKLWGFYKSNTITIPSTADLNRCLALVDYKNIEIKNDHVKLSTDQEIITGSFIKACATDEVVKFLKQQNVTDTIINAGGSTIVGINNKNHPHWTVNIPDPIIKDCYTEKIKINNQCFSLSARKNNSIEMNGKSYGHILNCNSGLPASTLQVGVLTKDAFLGDVISTALFCLEENEVPSFIEKMKADFEFSAYRIDKNKNKYTTDAFNSFF